MRFQLRATLVSAVLLTSVPPLAAQTAPDRGPVLAVVNRLFDGMRRGDSGMVRSTFHPRVQLSTAVVREGKPILQIGSLDDFLKAVGTPHDSIWDERISNEVVHQDGNLAVVWTDYRFFVGSRFSHCGVDAFQLIKEDSDWKIVALADTRRRTGC